ncbi:alpha/beta fold hydrolase [Yinghuangia seranimata]|uniref:alpha/beta fold hydrolase n=1 Tax=Yinghuangia seranimata TaxID=408067 RepID=UPI00248B437F|nr:alpha/beta hydrolase [Yinghuangia seranimata]MDI2130595.1 alpha/beta hydrolase [Yinghuangia seranimata]
MAVAGADPSLYPTPLPAAARRFELRTSGGPLAALEIAPPEGTEPRGTAVLVPGFSGSKEDFVPMLGALAAEGYRVVTYDQRGQFQSPGPTRWRDYSVTGFAAELAEVVTSLDAGRVHLLGHSFGGVVAQRAVTSAPDLVRSLTLLDTGPGGTDFDGGRFVKPMVLVLKVGGVRGMWTLMRRPLAKAGLTVGAQAWLHHRLMHTHKANLIGIINGLVAEPSRVRELAATKVPCLVMYGENDTPWSPPTQAKMAAELGARHVVVANAGHTPNEEQPEETAKALADFWRSVDED